MAGFLDDMRAIAARHPHTARITHFLVHPGSPVDRRHNAKIEREKLALWAATQIPARPALPPATSTRVPS